MNELLTQGVAVMCIGMGTVLAFLCITIGAMFVMSTIVAKLNKLFPEVVPQTAGATRSVASNDDEIAAAIIAAIFKRGK